MELKRRLGLLDAFMMVTGSMIGSGIFIVSAGMMRNLGSAGWLLMAWVVGGLLTVMAALSYGELAGMMPKAGGQYVYIRRAFGPLLSFLYGWTVFMVIQTGVIAAVAVAFTNFSAEFFPRLSRPIFTHANGWLSEIKIGQMAAVVLIVLITWINTVGIKFGKWLQITFTTAKILAIVGLVITGIWVGMQLNVLNTYFDHFWEAKSLTGNGDEGNPISGIGLLSALGLAMVGSLFSSDAWNNVTFIAGEIKDPKRNIPLSLVLGTAVVTGLYLLANISYLALLPIDELAFAENDRVGTAAAAKLFGTAGRFLMAALIMVSTFGCLNGIVMAGGRLFYAMAEDGLFFQQASKLNRQGIPAYALWAQCIWSCLLCLSGKYGQLLEYTTFASLLFYALTIYGLFVLRRQEPNAERPYKAFLYPWVPAGYIVFALAFCLNLLIVSPGFTVSGLLIVALGWPVYLLRTKMLPGQIAKD